MRYNVNGCNFIVPYFDREDNVTKLSSAAALICSSFIVSGCNCAYTHGENYNRCNKNNCKNYSENILFHNIASFS